MGVTNTTTVLSAFDHELGVVWYSDLFGREPDRRPVDGSTVTFAQTLTDEDR